MAHIIVLIKMKYSSFRNKWIKVTFIINGLFVDITFPLKINISLRIEAIASKLVLQGLGTSGGNLGIEGDTGLCVVLGLAGGPIWGRLVRGGSGYLGVGKGGSDAHLVEVFEPN